MRQMRNIHTGKIAVYDADLIEGGRWEPYSPEAAAPKEEAPKAKAPKAAAPKPFDQEFLNATETVQISVTDESGETTEHKV